MLAITLAIAASTAMAQTTVYDAIPGTLAPSYPSQPFQAQQTREFGDYVTLAGTDRVLNSVTITMVTWAYQSEAGNVAYCSANPTLCSGAGWKHDFTLNIYNIGTGTVGTRSIGSLIATVTQNKTVPWRPEPTGAPCGGTTWQGPDSNCYNGMAYNVTFDMSSLGAVLPNNVVVGIVYNTQTYGPAPIGVGGPFNSLNVGTQPGPAAVGTDDNVNSVFWNTSTAGWYADGGAAGVGVFREDSSVANWGGYGTIPIKITATSTITVTPATSPTASDNDYTRINNAVQAIPPGGTIMLSGTFDWTEPNAAASWAAGSDGVPGNDDDYSIIPPVNKNGVTITATSLGAATIQGPGDLPGANLEGVFQIYDTNNPARPTGDNKNWTISNLRFLDFDNPIGFYYDAESNTNSFEGTTIQNNYIRLARDLNGIVAPADVNQNIAIHLAFGQNQTITGNTIDLQGDGVSDPSASLANPSRYSTDVVLQSNTSGGNAYNGLQITNNTMRVLNAQDNTNPQRIRGIWENGHAHSSNITVSGNSFLNLAGGNNPAFNKQEAFWVTSHSSLTTTVNYANNYVSGARFGIKWLGDPEYPGQDYSGNQSVNLTSNTVVNSGTGILVQNNGLANLRFNRIVGNTVGLNNIAGIVNADDNWWGCNYGPGATGAGCAGTTNGILGTATAATWLTLTTSASTSPIIPGGTSNVTSRLTFNSANVDTSGSGAVSNTTPVAFAGTFGTVSPSSTTTAAGVAGTTFSATGAGAGGVATTVDGQTVSAAITVLPTCAPVSIATGQTTLRNAALTIPITAGDMTNRGVYSYDFTYTYNPSTLTYTGYSTAGTLSSGFTMTVHSPAAGTLVFSGFGSTPLSGAGTLLNVNFTAAGPIGSTSNLTLSPFTLNEGVPCANVTNGDITIISGTVDGTITYLNSNGNAPNPRVVAGVNLNAPGTPPVSGLTNGSGVYSLSGFGNSGYTVTPSKSPVAWNDPLNGISANDAARVAQHVVGVLPMTSNQQLAADVSNNGTITSFDSSIIARFVVNIPVPGVTGTWRFAPTNRSYVVSQLETGVTGENYDAILMGDVTGNWNSTGALWENLTDFEREQAIEVLLPEMTAGTGSEIVIPVRAGDTTGKGVISYQFELRYDPNVLAVGKTPCIAADTLSSTMTVTCNSEEPGIVRVAVFGVNDMLGKGELLRLKFNVTGEANSFSNLELVGFKFNESFPFGVARNGRVTVTEAAPSDSIGGRVLTSTGEPVGQARVTVTDQNGNARTMATNNFGNFRFAGLVNGGTYTVEVAARGLRFTPRSIVVGPNAGSIDITAEP